MKQIFSWLCILLFACGKKEVLPNPPLPRADTVRPVAPDTLRSILALGDSYTIGQGVPTSERFATQTVRLLAASARPLKNPVYIAQTGWTTIDLQKAIAAAQPSPNFDIVTLLIGVNDQYQRKDTAGYAERFAQLLQSAIGLAGGRKQRVFVLSIPDYSATPFVPAADKERVRREIDFFNSINRRITLAGGVDYTDITPSTRLAENDPSLIASDGLHPSGKEYGKWAALLAPKIEKLLR